jgi:hypothetical protein
MATERVATSIVVEGIGPARRALERYGRDVAPAMREVAQQATARFTPALMAAMRSDGGQSALVASTVRPVRDRVPAIAVGGARKVTPSSGGRRKKKPAAGDVFFGAEFGGRRRPTTQQFRPHTGRTGYAFYPALRDVTDDLVRAYVDGLDRLALDWEQGH